MIIPIDNQYSYTRIPRNKDLKLTITNSCNEPYKRLLVDHAGNCFVCGCEAYLPVSVGQILDFDSLDEIWSCNTAKALQKDIDDKLFTHCAVDRCGILDHDMLLPRHTVSINIDPSCNLACPSCRKTSVMITSGEEYEKKLQQVNHLVELLQKFNQPTRIIVSGNGDPLASAIMRPLIHNFTPSANQKIRLFTNGLLMEKQLDSSSILQHIDQFSISVDAGTAEVYEKVRFPGNFSVLQKNLQWLSKLNKHVELNFVVQRDNWQDTEAFIGMARSYHFVPIITKLEDWGTWGDKFSQHDILGNTAHEQHSAAVAELSRLSKEYPTQAHWFIKNWLN